MKSFKTNIIIIGARKELETSELDLSESVLKYAKTILDKRINYEFKHIKKYGSHVEDEIYGFFVPFKEILDYLVEEVHKVKVK